LQLDDPAVVLARTTDFIFEPEMEYEKNGQVPNVVFPCGTVSRNDTIFMYYGGGDSVVGVAKAKLSEILKALEVSL
jgi:beta-1,2-mannobiose phosphorylase / 1,2-beta-oligomannan phosphorylase